MFPARSAISLLLLAAALSAAAAPAQQSDPAAPPTSIAHRTRLVLKDGSYQQVMSYKLTGDTVNGMVNYISADRAGAQEDLPASLVDWLRYPALGARPRAPTLTFNAARAKPRSRRPLSILSPELAAEEADRTARHAEVAPGLHLPDSGAIFALDYFRGAPELVPLPQSGSDLNPLDSHAVVRTVLKPQAAPHALVTLKGEVSFYQMHVDAPVIYLRIGDNNPTGGRAFVVDTHGITPPKDEPYGGAATSRYVIVRTDPRVGARNVNSFTIPASSAAAGTSPTVIETTTKLPPRRPLDVRLPCN